MAFSGARTIVVRDRTYEWKFKGYGGKQPDHQLGSPKAARVLLRPQSDRPGTAFLSIDIRSKRWIAQEVHDMDIGHVQHRASFTPADAHKLIETVLDAGWNPDDRRHRFTMPVIDFTDYTTAEWKDIPTPPDPGWQPR